MTRNQQALGALVVLALLGLCSQAEETPLGKGLSESNKEYLVLDDMEDVSDWSNGTPEETTLSASAKRVKQGSRSLCFANRVDHGKGEKGYPVGWPRAGKDLAKPGLSDWSGYDLFECWIYAETSRPALPGEPLSIGFYHSSGQRSTSIPLKTIRKDAWTKIVIPIAELADPHDVRRVQLNISEANYRHGDEVDFYVDQMVLSRYVDPAIAEFSLERTVVDTSESCLRARQSLAGSKAVNEVTLEFEVGQGAQVAGKALCKSARQGELSLSLAEALKPGTAWARLSLRDPQGKLLDRSTSEFRVIQGPFAPRTR